MIFILSLAASAACGEWIAPIGSGSTTCQAASDCQTGETCHYSRCLKQCGDGVVQQGEGCDDGNDQAFDACTNACRPARCGDGIVHVGVEACDDGNENNFDACSSNCELSYCGDGLMRTDLVEGDDGYEACDDGDRRDDNGCTSSCHLNICGDGLHWPLQEACDDGNTVETDACLNNCQIARCGDGVVRLDRERGDDDFEACDDGNLIDEGDGCSNTCQRSDCGDGVIFSGSFPEDPRREECDDGNAFDDDACLTNCNLARCGDGILRRDLAEGEPGYEACDDGDRDNVNACNNACQGTMCGDGEINRNESCDDGNRVDHDGCPAGCGAGVIQLESHRYGTCALLERGWVYCWGSNHNGALGFPVPVEDRSGRFDISRATRLRDIENAVKLVNFGADRLCALLADGRAQCWGNNRPNGALGLGLDPRFFSASQPALVVGPDRQPIAGLVDLDCGLSGCCAAHGAGDVSCWGTNSEWVSQQARGFTQATAIAVGDFHQCVLVGEAGEVACSGDNRHGQLGQGTTEPSEEPVLVSGLPPIRSLYAFGDTTCGISRNHQLWCWGQGDRIGSARPETRSWWTDVNPGRLWGSRSRAGGRSVASEDLGCEPESGHCLEPVHLEAYGSVRDLRNESSFWAPQERTYLQDHETGHWLRLPNGDVFEMRTVTSSVRSGKHVHLRCELDEANVVRCFDGAGTVTGFEGTGRPRVHVVPTQMANIPRVRSFIGSLPTGINCVVDQGGQVHCWGMNSSFGRFGDPDFREPFTNQIHAVPNLQDVHKLRFLYYSGCALHGDGILSCWGTHGNFMGLGGEALDRLPQVIPVERVHDFDSTQTSGHGSNPVLCVVTGEQRRVFCAGANAAGQLGNGTDVNYFQFFERVPGLENVSQIQVSGLAACALDGEQQVSCWGTSNHIFWQEGEGPLRFSQPAPLSGLNSIQKFSLYGTDNHRFHGIKTNGEIINFGYYVPENSVEPLRAPTNVIDGCGNDQLTCVLTDNDQVWCWGQNSGGARGLSAQPGVLGPIPNTPPDLRKLFCSFQTTCALHGEGELSCWGVNLSPIAPGTDPHRVNGLEDSWVDE